jgi:stress-induced morphogen
MLRGDGSLFAAHVGSAADSGQTRVSSCSDGLSGVEGRMGSELHALALQTTVRAD